MFDGQFTSNGVSISTIYHSAKPCNGSDYGGVTVTFNKTIEYIDLEIYTRADCATCQDRYNSLGVHCGSPFLKVFF